ncbi:hypothetical protein JMF97_30270 [Micromonospora fiedleri]|uniref:Uncharacterized protein n=2 Tax=Micromonospora TaxID=1873 RepID=A0ABS1UX61_9ACTN|nr:MULTISPECIES: hypothetical protein [Micromonospora]MBL6280449.1 hypothetical protein [Micromonospora fiedleri]WSK45131.1 hypothetical protein OG712_14010 [Micromonospora maris]GIJ19293.1 hypothetical protein Vgi01_59770 [Micromonospora gifhornensis]
MTGERYSAAALERWNVVNPVLPDDGFDAAAGVRRPARRRSDPRPRRAMKQVLAHFERGGVPEANRHITQIAAELYRTEDLRSAVRSFLTDGPGKATFTGR